VMMLSNQCWQWHCRGDIGSNVISLPSHVGNGVAEVMLVVARYRCHFMLAMVLPSLPGDGIAKAMLAMA
jgi:hypothetical protein